MTRHQHAVNDKVESLAIKKFFGDGAYQIPVPSQDILGT